MRRFGQPFLNIELSWLLNLNHYAIISDKILDVIPDLRSPKRRETLFKHCHFVASAAKLNRLLSASSSFRGDLFIRKKPMFSVFITSEEMFLQRKCKFNRKSMRWTLNLKPLTQTRKRNIVKWKSKKKNKTNKHFSD